MTLYMNGTGQWIPVYPQPHAGFQNATLSIGPGDKAMVVFIASNLAIKHRQRAIANTR